MVVALPETEEQVCRILRICHEMLVPVVARGAGTGFRRRASERGDALAREIHEHPEVDDRARIARTAWRTQFGHFRSGRFYGLYYAPDPSSQLACSIGGNVAENSRGRAPPGIRPDRAQHTQARVATIEGEIVEIGSEALDAAGYDLLALMTGSEGLLGVVTEVTAKLLPKPEFAQVVMAAFDDVENAGHAVANIIAAGIIPAGLEMMDQAATCAVEDFAHAGYRTDVASILLCESDGTQEEVADEIRRVQEIMERSGAVQTQVSRDEPERLRFWAGRKAARFRRSGASRPTTTVRMQYDTAQAAGRGAAQDHGAGAEARPALCERLPRGRW